jgi:hypothetical protein
VRVLITPAIVMTLVGIFVAPLAFARIMSNTIDPVAVVTDHGRHLVVTGPIACTAGETAYLRITVTQRFTGAVAEGQSRITCTGETDIQPWEVLAVTQGKASFEQGSAWAVGFARTTDRGDTTDAHQWLVNVMLVAE